MYKYNEDKILNEIVEYINSTYSQHYATDNNISCLDAIIALGGARTTFRDNALKYLWRNFKKGELKDSRKDVMKAIHYCILMLNEIDKEVKK